MSEILWSRPKFEVEEAKKVVEDFYGLESSLVELPSERDQNWHVLAKGAKEFVLKISNAAERRESIEFQNRVIDHLAAKLPQFTWPRLQPTRKGERIISLTHSRGRQHFARLLSYLHGPFLAQIQPHPPELLQSFGRFLAEMDRALMTFPHRPPEKELKWDMKRAIPTLHSLFSFMEGEEERKCVAYFLRLYEEQGLPLLPELRTSLIHNDANDYNVLVGHVSSDPAGRFRRILGIIDFGDMVHGYTVSELAIGIAYAAMNKKDPLEAAAHMVAAYHDVLPLREPEVEALYVFVAMRLCLSVAIAAEQKRLEEGNEYLAISEKPAWSLLWQWRDIHPAWARCVFRHACRLPACPPSVYVSTWLKTHHQDFGPLLETDDQKKPPLVLDLSLTSPELVAVSAGESVEELSGWISRRLAHARRKVALGRYNEIRSFYNAETFKVVRNDRDEQRTLHLGIDLFSEAGTPVFAPLDGVIHSFNNNRRPLDYGPTVILEHRIDEEHRFFTLYGHLSEDSLAELREGKVITKGQPVGRIGRPEENGGWPPHVHFQIIVDLLGWRGDFPGAAPPSQKEIWLNLCPDPTFVLGMVEELPAPTLPVRTKEEILRLRRKHLGPNLSIAYRHPLKIVRGFRQYLYDENGQPYLDAVNNVAHVGHCHPRVVRAAREQIAVLNTNTRYLHDYIIEYALRLARKLPAPLSVFYFVSSGSEANDLALRLAWTHTGRKDVLVVDGAYHGNLSSLIDISPYKFDGPGGKGQPPHVHKVPTPDVYRGAYRASEPRAGFLYAQTVKEAIKKMEEEGRGLAAFICESLMSCAGQIVYPEGYLAEAFASVREAGGVCIADEVQVGFGRVGTHFWGFETQGVCPDIVTMGKPIGNGHPLAAVVTTPEIAASFDTGMEYFNTYGGNPVSCAVGLAVLDVIEEEGLQSHAHEVGTYLKARLNEIKSRCPLIGDVRGLGLFLGVELVLDREKLWPATREAAYVVDRMREKGVLLSLDGPFRNVLKIKPPLVFTKADADFLAMNLAEVLTEDALQKSVEFETGKK